MGRAEERAFERYSITRGDDTQETSGIDMQRVSDFIDGYHQAEEDLKLTWEDIESIHTLMAHQEVAPILWKCGYEAFYQEVLKRFYGESQKKKYR